MEGCTDGVVVNAANSQFSIALSVVGLNPTWDHKLKDETKNL